MAPLTVIRSFFDIPRFDFWWAGGGIIAGASRPAAGAARIPSGSSCGRPRSSWCSRRWTARRTASGSAPASRSTWALIAGKAAARRSRCAGRGCARPPAAAATLARDLVQVEVARRALEQDVDRVADQAQRADHEQAPRSPAPATASALVQSSSQIAAAAQQRRDRAQRVAARRGRAPRARSGWSARRASGTRPRPGSRPGRARRSPSMGTARDLARLGEPRERLDRDRRPRRRRAGARSGARPGPRRGRTRSCVGAARPGRRPGREQRDAPAHRRRSACGRRRRAAPPSS